MRKMATRLAFISPILWLPLLLGADQRARTEDGREVILRDDGTWVYADKPKVDKKGAAKEFKKDKKAVLQYKSKRGVFALYLPPDTWKKSATPQNPDAEVKFIHKDGDMMAMVIAERIEIPAAALAKTAVDKIKSLDKDAKVIREEKRIVNGKEVLCLVISAKVHDISFIYYNYYYSGDEGSIQVVTWTGRNLFKEVKPELERFLNGFEIIKR